MDGVADRHPRGAGPLPLSADPAAADDPAGGHRGVTPGATIEIRWYDPPSSRSGGLQPVSTHSTPHHHEAATSWPVAPSPPALSHGTVHRGRDGRRRDVLATVGPNSSGRGAGARLGDAGAVLAMLVMICLGLVLAVDLRVGALAAALAGWLRAQAEAGSEARVQTPSGPLRGRDRELAAGSVELIPGAPE